MTWQPVDCHAHSTFSDGELSVAAAGRARRSLASGPASPTTSRRDVSQSASHSVADGPRIPRRARALRRAARRRVLLARLALARAARAISVRRFTHRLGSLHAVACRTARSSAPSRAACRRPHAGRVHGRARRLPRALRARDARRHPRASDADPAPAPHLRRRRALDRSARGARRRRALAAPASRSRSRIAIRPHERLVRRAVDRGVRISLGSDGHTCEQVADLAQPLALARSIGVRDEDLYDPVRHGSRTGFFGATHT